MSSGSLPEVPLTLEGASVLHQMFRVRKAPEAACGLIAALEEMEGNGSALYSMLGHKADLMLLHFRRSFEELNAAELALARAGLADYLEATTSFVSVVELGLYESSARLYSQLAEKHVAPGTPQWEGEIEEALAYQRKAMAPRLWPEIPARKFICFYPMDRRRGEERNWYRLPLAERRRQMQAHGEIGRRYAGQVQQIISGAIGLDDWEWGVDLFADDPVLFKKLIYEMRFDEASAVYALFGPFYVGLRIKAADLTRPAR